MKNDQKTEMMSTGKMLSIVLASYYSGDRARLCYEKLGKRLSDEKIPFELIIIDDGSKDDSYANALKLERAHDNVRAYRLSRNYGSFYAAFAGLSLCRGACAMPICDDEQQPYQTVVDMYRLWEQGHKVIIPYRKLRKDSRLSSFLSNIFYRIMNSLSETSGAAGTAGLIQNGMMHRNAFLYLDQYEAVTKAGANDYYIIAKAYFDKTPALRMYSSDSKK